MLSLLMHCEAMLTPRQLTASSLCSTPACLDWSSGIRPPVVVGGWNDASGDALFTEHGPAKRLNVPLNTTIVFKYNAPHTVFVADSEARTPLAAAALCPALIATSPSCSQTAFENCLDSGTRVAGMNHGGGTGMLDNEYSAVATASGVLHIFCEPHCRVGALVGQKMRIFVGDAAFYPEPPA